MNFISCRKCGRRDLRCNCSYSRITIILLSLFLLIGCVDYSHSYTVIDSHGKEYKGLFRMPDDPHFNYIDKNNKKYKFSGNYTVAEE